MYKIIKEFKGSPNGSTVIDYKEGEIVELESGLAKVALEEDWAELIDLPVDPVDPPVDPVDPPVKTTKKRP